MKKAFYSVATAALALGTGSAMAFPATPCAVATATCKTVILSGTSSVTNQVLSARAIFNITGTSLTVTLSNISGDDVTAPPDVLTSLFFNLRDNLGGLVGLSPVSALIAPGSDVVFGPQPAGDNVGGEWEYLGGLAGPSGLTQGISSSGLGLFGDANFNGPEIQGPPGPSSNAVDGLQFGLLSAGDNTATGNTPVTGTNQLVKDSTVFTLNISGTHTFDLTKSGAIDVAFQYGTSLTEPRLTPAPATIPLIGVALACLLGVRKKRKS